MIAYHRPEAVVPVFRDADGAVIDYGSRWDDPPGDAYSVTSNLERFAPLHDVADALIAWLTTAFDVTATDDLATAEDLLHPPAKVVRSVRLTPRDPASAPLTFAFTSFPGVIVHAGALQETPFPFCGCDACDETWDGQADELESSVMAVVDGRFAERLLAEPAAVTCSLRAPDGSRAAGGSNIAHIPTDRLRSTSPLLTTAGDPWRAWPHR